MRKVGVFGRDGGDGKIAKAGGGKVPVASNGGGGSLRVMKRLPAPRTTSRRLIVGLGAGVVGLGGTAWQLHAAGRARAAGLVGVLGFFVLVWTGLAVISRRKQRREAARDAMRAQYPDAPWEWVPEWHERRIRSGGWGGTIVLAVMGTAFVGGTAPIVWRLPAEVRSGNYAPLVVLLFWLVGGAMLVGALRVVWQRWRHGALTFVPEPLPGSWGGWLGGVVHVARGARLGGDAELTLRCRQRSVSTSAQETSVSERTLWQDELVLARERLEQGTLVYELPVRWGIGRGCGKPSTVGETTFPVTWVLGVRLPQLGGGVVRAEFDVPVFDCGEDVPPEARAGGVLPAVRVKTDLDLVAEAGMTESREADAQVWRFLSPMARRAAWLQLGFGAGMLVIGVVLPWFFQIVVSAFALVPLSIGASLRWHRSELRKVGGRLTATRWSWRGRRTSVVDLAEVGDLRLTQAMENNLVLYYRLILVGRPGVDAAKPHPFETFRARKARYRWQRATQRGELNVAAEAARVMQTTPRFEIEVASCLKGARPAASVRDRLLLALLD